MEKSQIIKTIVEALRPLDPEKVVLFGSFAAGTMDAESDVDLYVVSKENYLPLSYAENMRHYKKYARPLKELKREVPLDLLIHTRAMNRKFEEDGGSFAREIMQKGERLL